MVAILRNETHKKCSLSRSQLSFAAIELAQKLKHQLCESKSFVVVPWHFHDAQMLMYAKGRKNYSHVGQQ